MEQFNNQNNLEVNGGGQERMAEYEKLLWQRAEEFSLIRQAIEKRVEELDQLFNDRPIDTLNLHERDERMSEEKEYWEAKAEISSIQEEENKIEEALVELGGGVLDEEKVASLLPEQTDEEKKISKRKKAILEEKRRLGIDPRDIMSEMYGELGREKMRLTTGRHDKGVKNLGSIDPLSAAAEFYYRTTDSHGGKVDYGKRSASYVSSSGKRIRKK